MIRTRVHRSALDWIGSDCIALYNVHVRQHVICYTPFNKMRQTLWRERRFLAGRCDSGGRGGKIRRKTWGKGEPKEKVKRGTYPACADVCCIQEEVVQPDKLVAASLMVCFAAWQCWLAPFLPVAADEITIIAMSHRTSTARQRLFCRIGWVSTSRL